MSSPPSGSESAAFDRLDARIRHWIWTRGWRSLRAVQELAAPLLLDGASDVILAAPTSAGKTEAAFFPLLTRLAAQEEPAGLILSISPLKALINDQTERLLDICEQLDVPLIGWHGDVSRSRKESFLRQRRGVLIITPESLEALFVNRGSLIPSLAGAALGVVVDELHSFIGSERGRQLQSLLHRLETAGRRRIPRVGLSATLGDSSLAAEFLRPGAGSGVRTVDASGQGYELRLVVKGYIDDWSVLRMRAAAGHPSGDDEDESPEGGGPAETGVGGGAEEEDAADRRRHAARYAIVDYLYEHLRGTNNLIFPNSRGLVEFYADRLRRRSEREGVPNEFWPHHGSLSREVRQESEAALRRGQAAATAVATTTLELGIDIGSIRSVAQIGPPPSVASLRQRLGRSGRRPGEAAILRCLAIERILTPQSALSVRIREGLIQTVAMVRLMIDRWVEPPRPGALHASTLVQQILSILAERGGATAEALWQTLVGSGVFRGIRPSDLAELLHVLGSRELICQEESGALLPGPKGERMIHHFDFYAAFQTGEEYRLVAEGRTLGSVPVRRQLVDGQRIVFAGRRWKVARIDYDLRAIYVEHYKAGAPLDFEGVGEPVHDRVREEMRRVLSGEGEIPFLDEIAREVVEEARRGFREAHLESRRSLEEEGDILLLGWKGDLVQDALARLLTARELIATNEGAAIRVASPDAERVRTALGEIADGLVPTVEDLNMDPQRTVREKWDWALPAGLRLRSYASAALDLAGARDLAGQLARNETPDPGE